MASGSRKQTLGVKAFKKEYRPLIRLVLNQGWRWKRLGSGHVMFFPPDKTFGPVTVSLTGDRRGMMNARADFKARGLKV